MPFLDPPFAQFYQGERAKIGKYIGSRHALHFFQRLTASTPIRFQISAYGGSDREAAGAGLDITRDLFGAPVEKAASPDLRLREGEGGCVVGIARVVSGSQGFVVLFTSLVPKSGNPTTTGKSPPITERASHRDDRPIGFPPGAQPGAGRATIDFGICDPAGQS
jgi:hypothetical protein